MLTHSTFTQIYFFGAAAGFLLQMFASPSQLFKNVGGKNVEVKLSLGSFQIRLLVTVCES